MGTKRKSNEAQLPEQPQVRRSRRNAEKNEDQVNNEEVNLNGESNSKVLKNKKLSTNAKLTKITKQTRRKPTKQTARAIINEKIDFNKDLIPIKTYGKLDQSSTNIIKNNVANATADNQTEPTKTTLIKKKVEQVKKKGNLTINSSKIPTKIEITSNNNNLKSTQPQAMISTLEAGGQKRIIINKIIMPPDAYNQMIKQSPQQPTSSNQKITTTAANDVPVQNFIKGLQTNLGSIVLSSGIKVIPNLTVANPQLLTTANILPINQLTQLNQFTNNKNANIRIVTSPTAIINQVQQQTGTKQLQLPIVIKSIINPINQVSTNQPPVSTQAKISSNLNLINRVNPITSVRTIPSISTNNKTLEKAVINIDTTNKKEQRTRKARVSFNFEKNTSTSIKPIPNDLPLTVSNVLMTSTPKQSIIKKPKIFDLPCTPIVNSNLNSRRTTASNKVTIVNKQSSVDPLSTNKQKTITEQVKQIVKNNYLANTKNHQLEKQTSIKYCKSKDCECWTLISKDEIENIKKDFKSLNAPKKQLYIYCNTIKVNDKVELDFEKYIFHLKSSKGFVQVCHRVFMDVFEKSNLSFVDTAFKKFNS